MNPNENQTITINQNDEKKTTVQIRTHENMKDSLNMLRLLIQSEQDIKKGNFLKQDELFEKLGKELFGE